MINAQQAQNNLEPLKRQPFDDSVELFNEKLKNYDRIEGYDKDDEQGSLYQRAEVTAYLIDEDGKETGETV